MRLIITGSAGMLGRALVKSIFAESWPDTVFLTRTECDLGQSDAEAILGRVLDCPEPTALINAAAYTDVNGAETHWNKAWQGNAAIPALLAHVCSRYSSRLVHVSTDYVFDGTKSEPYLEWDPLHPINAYGASKAEGELKIKESYPNGHAIVRTSWLFGPHGRCFPATILRLAREGRPLKIVADQNGSPTLTLHLAAALLELAALPNTGDTTGIFHACNQGVTTWYGFARRILDGAGLGHIPIEPMSSDEFLTPALRPAWSVLGGSRLQSAGILALPSWEEAVGLYLSSDEL